MALNASDGKDRVEQLIALTERLTDRLAEETRAFEARRPGHVAAMAEETARLANIYRHESSRIKGDPSLISSAPDDLRRRLIAATRAFEAVLARHGRALEAVKIVTEGLVRAIAREVADNRRTGVGYGPDSKGKTGSAASITLNRTA